MIRPIKPISRLANNLSKGVQKKPGVSGVKGKFEEIFKKDLERVKREGR